jgi:putative PIN family toxin of toxin-antitoxin system
VKRLVLDTNVVIAALIWNGTPRRVLSAGHEEKAILMTSAQLLTELRVDLSRSKSDHRIYEARQTVDGLIAAYTWQTISVLPFPIPRIVSDPDDNVVIGTALAANANLVVTGDKALLSIVEYEGIRIVPPVEALSLLDAG